MHTSYAASEIRALLRRGPHPGEEFFRLKATGAGETRWVNVTPEQLEGVAQLLDLMPQPDHPAHV